MRAISFFCISILLTACGGGGSSSPTPTPTPTPTSATANSAPIIVGDLDLVILEGTTEVGTITATDEDGDELSFSIVAGDDRDLFNLDTSGVLSFAAAARDVDADADEDNIYRVSIQVSDGLKTDSKEFTVTVGFLADIDGDIIDGPMAGAAVYIDLNENGRSDNEEPETKSDEFGKFTFEASTISWTKRDRESVLIVSEGGTDIATGQALPNLVLRSRIYIGPGAMRKRIGGGELNLQVSPLTSVVANLTRAAANDLGQSLLGGVEAFHGNTHKKDIWARAIDGDVLAQRVQRLNAQIGALMTICGLSV